MGRIGFNRLHPDKIPCIKSKALDCLIHLITNSYSGTTLKIHVSTLFFDAFFTVVPKGLTEIKLKKELCQGGLNAPDY
jgi:hypothetical protein